MPGTHDSATKYVRFKPICNTQNLTIEEQLQIGVRYLDMRFELKDGRKLVAVHSIADCKKERGLNSADLIAADTVNMCESFLKENPGETILFQLKEDDGDAASFMRSASGAEKSFGISKTAYPLSAKCAGR